jgi:LysM repeat protein
MNKVYRRSGLWLAVGLVGALLMAGCTLKGSTGMGEVTAVAGPSIEQPVPQEEPTGQPTPTEGMSPVDIIGTEAAATQTAEAVVPTVLLPTEEPTEEPEPVEEVEQPEPVEPAAPAPAAGGTCTHTVQTGENLFRIALRYGTTYQALAQANGIANPSRITAGTVLTIPGENLFRIALRYGKTWTEVAAYNNISNPNDIVAGQVILIPQ